MCFCSFSLFVSLAQQAEPYLGTSSSSSSEVAVDEKKQVRFVASLLSLLATTSSNVVISSSDSSNDRKVVSDDVDAAASSEGRLRTGDPLLKVGYPLWSIAYITPLTDLLCLLQMGFVRGDLEALVVVAGLVGRLGAARHARFEALMAVDAGAVAAGMQGVGAEVGARLEKHREQLAHSLLMVQRGAEEALSGCREDLARRLHENSVTFDNKLASTAFRIR